MDQPPPKRLRLGTDVSEPGQASAAHGTVSSDGGHLRENDVGISEYINAHPGFFAVLKQRYSDFMVHEISTNGQTVQLTTYELPKAAEREDASPDLKQLISIDDHQSLQELSESGDQARHVEIEVSSSKEARTLIHKGIRNQFPVLDSRTMDCGNGSDKKQAIRVFLKRKDTRMRWPSGRGGYVKFVLYKENRDTMWAVQSLSKMLRVKPSNFQYAGTKDKRAITSQLMTVFRVLPESLLTTNGATSVMKAGNFEFCDKALNLGDLKGNRFSIVLRNVSCETEVIRDTVKSLSDNGFLNYFGMQRFGTSVIPTHSVGKALLHSDWKEAVDLILRPRTGESDDMLAAREVYWKKKDVQGAIALMPARKAHSVEMQLLKGLNKYGPTNLLAAFSFLSRNQRLLYVHSYQSLIWNRMASCRVREFGLKPVVGDLVYRRKGGEIDTGDHVEMKDVEYISEENVDTFSIRDVVLPLPGDSIVFPKNKIGELYLEALAKDSLSPEKMRHRVKDFFLHGDYRHLVVVPTDVQWETLQYDDVTIPLTLSDTEVMEGKTPPTSLPGGKLKALKLQFVLPPSTYATMALREVMKMDTSSHYQSQLNKQQQCKEEELPDS